jgi:hypothetical protein
MTNRDHRANNGFRIDDGWSPRLDAVWDFTGTGRGKLSGAWGRFYYALPLDMANRQFSPWGYSSYALDAGACGFSFAPGGGAGHRPGDLAPSSVGFPIGGAAQGWPNATTCSVLPLGEAPDVGVVGQDYVASVDSKLQGSAVDELSASFEYGLTSDVVVGVDYHGRRQVRMVEDMSSDDGNTFFIGNPGVDREVRDATGNVVGNAANATTRDPATGRYVDIRFPKPTRTYDALTLRLSKWLSRRWLAQASYTWSSLRGNYSGPYYSEYAGGQLDPGITAAYDLASLMANQVGPLPGDHRHTVKLYGAYTFELATSAHLTASASYFGTSGTPVSILGAHPSYGSGLAFVVPRGMGGVTPFTHGLDVGAAFTWTARAPLSVTLRVDAFNVLDLHTATGYDNNYTFNPVLPVTGLDCRHRDAVAHPDPLAAVQADCPGLKYLKTTAGNPVTVNPNWGRVTAQQDARWVRVGLSLAF